MFGLQLDLVSLCMCCISWIFCHVTLKLCIMTSSLRLDGDVIIITTAGLSASGAEVKPSEMVKLTLFQNIEKQA